MWIVLLISCARGASRPSTSSRLWNRPTSMVRPRGTMSRAADSALPSDWQSWDVEAQQALLAVLSATNARSALAAKRLKRVAASVRSASRSPPPARRPWGERAKHQRACAGCGSRPSRRRPAWACWQVPSAHCDQGRIGQPRGDLPGRGHLLWPERRRARPAPNDGRGQSPLAREGTRPCDLVALRPVHGDFA